MKNLLIMRHAKSDWGQNLPDIERPLNKRGKKAAPLMAEQLKKMNKIPELIISSPAQRAMSTAERVKENLNLKKDIKVVETFYFGYMADVIEEIKNTDDQYDRILIVGHNPVWEDLVSELSSDHEYIVMPTAAIASVIFDANSWRKIKKGKLEWMITPKGVAS